MEFEPRAAAMNNASFDRNAPESKEANAAK